MNLHNDDQARRANFIRLIAELGRQGYCVLKIRGHGADVDVKVLRDEGRKEIEVEHLVPLRPFKKELIEFVTARDGVDA